MNNIQELNNLTLDEAFAPSGTRYEADRKSDDISLPPLILDDVIRRVQPMGWRVIVDTPLTLQPGRPLFAIRVTPTWMTNIEALYFYGDDANLNRVMADNPVFIPVFNGEDGVTNPPVRVSNYGTPPPLCKWSRLHKYCQGSLQYQIVCTAGSIVHGYLQASLVRGIPYPKFLPQPTVGYFHCDIQNPEFTSIVDNFVIAKPSLEPYIEVTAPLTEGTVVKEMAFMSPYESGVFDPHGFDAIFVYSKGTISSLNNSQLTFEINISAGPDFQFFEAMPLRKETLSMFNTLDYMGSDPTKEAAMDYYGFMHVKGITFPTKETAMRESIDPSTGKYKKQSSGEEGAQTTSSRN